MIIKITKHKTTTAKNNVSIHSNINNIEIVENKVTLEPRSSMEHSFMLTKNIKLLQIEIFNKEWLPFTNISYQSGKK